MTLLYATTEANRSSIMFEKRPSLYAAEYLLCKTKSERQAVADSVPDKFKKLVQVHIQIAREKDKFR